MLALCLSQFTLVDGLTGHYRAPGCDMDKRPDKRLNRMKIMLFADFPSTRPF